MLNQDILESELNRPCISSILDYEMIGMGEEVWEERTGQAVERTDWRKGAKDEWAAKERAVLRGNQFRSVDRDQVYDKG